MQGVVFCFGKDYANSLRPQKGQSLLTLADDYVSLDIETTGLDSHFDEIIELAAVRVSNSQVVEQFQTLVKPEQPISPYITDLTGISDLMVANAPSLEDALPKFLSFVGHSIVIAHNANFDINFIYDFTRLFDLPPFSNDFIDTCRLSRRIFREWENHKLATLIKNLSIAQTVEHRALSDCIQVHLCYEAMKQHIQANQIDLSAQKNYSTLSRQISPTTDQFDPDSPFYGKVFAFTGALERMTRRDAMQIVVDSGGLCGDGVTQKTNYLVLGNNDYCASIKDGKSSKQKKAEKMKLDGFDIEIISENVFYDMMEQHGSYTQKSDPQNHLKLSGACVFSLIEPILLSVIEKNNAPISALRLSNGQQYDSVMYSSSVLCHLHFCGNDSFIDVPSPARGSSTHISISDEDDLIAKIEPISARLDYLIDKSPTQFDCCSRYIQCSDALRCIHPDPSLGVGCRYRRVLKSGRVFYGKNATQ